MTASLTRGQHPGTPDATPAPVSPETDDRLLDEHDGWQALAVASLGRLLTATELAAAEHLPVTIALDLLFPHLDDASRHEALTVLG